MAKKKSNIDVPEGFIDYYVLYGIDRNMSTKEIRKLLLQKQGEIRSNIANSSLNGPEGLNKLQEMFNKVASALKTFKNDNRRKEYDTILDVAYATGKLDNEAQVIAQELYKEIEAMFIKGNYRGTVKKCMDALNNNVQDHRIYILLAQSYLALNDSERSLNTIDKGLQIHPNNMPLLKAGARFSNEGKQDYDRAQRYINKMMEIDSDSPLAISEQSYLYLRLGKENLANNLIDEYVEKHPNDMDFRKDVAYDMVGYSYTCYTKDPDSDAYVIASEEDYQRSINSCNKAASLYNDKNVQDALNNAKAFGMVEFNDENKESIVWLFLGGFIYLIFGIVFSVGTIVENPNGNISSTYLLLGILGYILVAVLGGLLIYSGIRLRQLSYRPYWQINKFILTGQREKSEGKYILIGKIFVGLIKWGFKIWWRLFKIILRVMAEWMIRW